jgi:hypothetical protein
MPSDEGGVANGGGSQTEVYHKWDVAETTTQEIACKLEKLRSAYQEIGEVDADGRK